MKIIAFFLFLFFAVLLQGTLFNSLSIQGIKPDFPLILSYGIGLYKGEMKGLLFGGFIGLLIDSSTGILLGPNLTSKAIVGFSSGYLKKKIFRVTYGVNLVFLFALSLLDGIMNFILINIFVVSSSFQKSFLTLILPQAVYSSLLGVLILIFIERVRPELSRTVNIDVGNK